MRIKIEGSQTFQGLIPAFHKTLMERVLKKLPEFAVLNHIEIKVIETTQLSDLGLSRFDFKEMLINHQLTKSNPKLLLEVYGHELAHFLITFLLNKNVQHEAPWQRVMVAMELPPRDAIAFSAQTLSQNQIINIRCGCYVNNTKRINQGQFHKNMTCPVCHKAFTPV